MRDIYSAVIHCSATPANVCMHITVPGEDIGVKEITEWHLKRGYATIGYHYVIRRSGLIEVGRAIERIGAHVLGHNSNSIGICLVGGIDTTGRAENNFEPPQWEALIKLLADLTKRFPTVKHIKGHRDYPKVHKECPCFDVAAWLKQVGFRHDLAA